MDDTPELSFLIKIYCDHDLRGIVRIINDGLDAQFEIAGGKIRVERYSEFYVSLEPYDFFEPSQPPDFRNNYTFEVFVTFDHEVAISASAYTKTVKFSETLLNILQTANCLTKRIFTFVLPDDRDPLELLNK